MNKNSEAIVIFCSHLCAASDIKPLEPREWGELASLLFSKGLEPKDLLFFSKSDFLEKLDELKQLATIPSREGLLTMFASGLLAIPRDFAICLDLHSKNLEN